LLHSFAASMLELMTRGDTIAVQWLEATAARDGDLIARLTDLVNGVYAIAESGLWRDGISRTTASELADLIVAGQIAVATRRGRPVGSVHVHDVAPDTSKFGMLVAALEHRGAGIGRTLVEFAERSACERGLRAMQLELLVPRTWQHPSKEFLRSWYGRCGYRVVRTRTVDETHPLLAPLLATPCDLLVHEKSLQKEQAA
jgi:GNAT superfamily N-acetyltransferase